MRLLTPSQNQNAKALEQAREAMRVKEFNDEAEKSRIELANSQADFNRVLAENRDRWAKEEANHAQRMVQMSEEVIVLEERKQRALEPIELRAKDVDRQLSEANRLLKSAKQREEHAEDLSETLQDRLDELGEREQNIISGELNVKRQEAAIAIQDKSIQAQMKGLSEAIGKFADEKLAWEIEKKDDKNKMTMWQRSLKTKEEENIREWEVLQRREKQLIDREATLKRNFDRLSPMKHEE